MMKLLLTLFIINGNTRTKIVIIGFNLEHEPLTGFLRLRDISFFFYYTQFYITLVKYWTPQLIEWNLHHFFENSIGLMVYGKNYFHNPCTELFFIKWSVPLVILAKVTKEKNNQVFLTMSNKPIKKVTSVVMHIVTNPHVCIAHEKHIFDLSHSSHMSVFLSHAPAFKTHSTLIQNSRLAFHKWKKKTRELISSDFTCLSASACDLLTGFPVASVLQIIIVWLHYHEFELKAKIHCEICVLRDYQETRI